MSNKYPGGIITSGANAGYSVFFDGTGDYLSVNNAAFNFSGTDFTIEFWLYNTGTTSDTMLLQWGSGAAGDIQFVVNQGGTSGAIALGTSGVAKTAASVSANNRWVYVAGVRSGTTYYTYVDGTRYTTQSSGTPSASTSFNIASGMTGYISNLRISNTARYTSTTMVVPNILQTDANTKLWTCLGYPIVDQSGNSYTITINGDTKVSNFTPLQGYVAYNPALGAATPGIWSVSDAIQAAQTRRWNMYDPYFNLTTLLLHGNGTNGAQNNTFLDSSSNNFTITRNGNTTQGTFSPFSQTGWSVYFDGNASCDLAVASTAQFNWGTSDFCIEAFVYPQSFPSGARIINFGDSIFNFEITSSGFLNYFQGSSYTATTGALATNTWTHCVITRQSGTIRMFANGILVFTNTNTTSKGTSTANIGSFPAGGDTLLGYLSNLRVINGNVPAAYQTSSTTVGASIFTVPTTALTAVTGTALLTCQSNRFVDNSGNSLSVTVGAGTPSVQAFSPFLTNIAYTPTNQGGSGYFDGNGDYVALPNSSISLSSGNCAVEFWCYITGEPTTNPFLFDNFGNSSARLYAYYDGNTMYLNADGVVRSTTFNYNSWNLFQFTRTSGTGGWYLNGSLISTTFSTSGTIDLQRMTIGAAEESGSINTSQWTQGYISNFRASTTNRSTSVPTTPFTSDANTSLLLNFTNAGIVDSTAKNVLETVGNAQISTTQSKFGGSSMYFDGSGDYLTTPNTLNGISGTGDFTVEFWMFSASYAPSGSPAAFSTMFATSTFTGTGFGIKMQDTNGFGAVWYNNTQILTGTSNLANSTWNHIALSRAGSTIRLFVNGTLQASATNTTSFTVTAEYPLIGADTSARGFFNGYIDDLRVTRYARYTGNFTPQTSQWQDQ